MLDHQPLLWAQTAPPTTIHQPAPLRSPQESLERLCKLPACLLATVTMVGSGLPTLALYSGHYL